MSNDRRLTGLATVLGMTRILLDKRADDMAAGKLGPAEAESLASILTGVCVLLRMHARTNRTGHPTLCPTPTLTAQRRGLRAR